MIREDKCSCFRTLAALLLVSVIFFESVSPAQEHQRGIIAKGSIWETEYYVIDGEKPGPVVMIVGGIHGNEPAGCRAVEQIRHWNITRGELIVLPRANRPSLQRRTRRMPELPRDCNDLNRNFPKADGERPRCALSRAIWNLVSSHRPDWLLDLHEGYDFTQINKKSVGNSIIAGRSTKAKKVTSRILDVLNETIKEPEKKFVLKSPPAGGSLARAASEFLGVNSMILETSYQEQPLSLRTRQHRIMVHQFLSDLRMVSNGIDVLVSPSDNDNTIHAALYDAGGTGSNGPRAIEKDLQGLADIIVRRVGPAEICNGALKQFHILIVPGGSGSKQARAIGNDGRKAIVEFVKSGGGYVGFCAGSYLASQNYTWSLKIVDAKVIDRKHWKRGKGQVKIELTAEGQRLLDGEPGLVDIRYANGPILADAHDPNIPDFKSLAIYRTEIAENGAPEGVMKGTPAIVAGRFGQGRVFSSSPHPEYTNGLETFVHCAVRWAAGR
jgi:glutamine amidotransferase-like uncharacterized protein